METVTSLQEVSALHNISPRTVAENQTELESSGRPGDRSRSKSVKDIRERRLLDFGGFRIELKWCSVRNGVCGGGEG